MIIKNKIFLAKNTLKHLQDSKESQRKLDEGTDVSTTDSESGATNGTQSNTTAPVKEVPVEQPVASTPKKTDNTATSLQIKKIYNFTEEEIKITYNVFFYFLGRKIVKTIVVRVKIVYYSRNGLRNLQSNLKAQSVPSNCNIKDEYKDKIGTIGTGDNIDYECEAPTEEGVTVTNATLDTDYPLLADNEEIKFENINFYEEAAKEATNIAQAKTYTISGVLDNSKVEFGRNSFKIIGTPIPSNLLSSVSEIPLEFIDYSSGTAQTKNINCKVASSTTLQCDESIRTYISNITKAKSTDESILLNINVADEETGDLVGTTSGGIIVNKKSSSGLSGGAIAGIVIACIVVLIAASVAVIMLRKPTPPIDNTTNIKIVENL